MIGPGWDRLLALVDGTQGATDLLKRAYRAGNGPDGWLLVALAADLIALEHPADIPDPILLRDVLGTLFLGDNSQRKALRDRLN